MPLIRFTQNIQRHVPCPPATVTGATVRDALESYFAANPPARGYVLDDQGALRKHMAIFINGEPVLDRAALADPVPPDATLDIIQALSGG
jgi:molybdopterin synthase sulfur carrier subunit